MDIKTKYHKLKKERKHFFSGGYIFLVVMSLSNVHKNDGNKILGRNRQFSGQ